MLTLLLVLLAQSPDPHHEGVDTRGDHAMGFDHGKTVHHFHLTKEGGTIEVGAKDPGDSGSRAAIRAHLEHIAKLFAAGDFSAPMFIHDRVPPGVPTMQRLKDRIRYAAEGTDTGALVRITTADPEALGAIHEFLKFQISDHRTGDPRTVPEPQR